MKGERGRGRETMKKIIVCVNMQRERARERKIETYGRCVVTYFAK